MSVQVEEPLHLAAAGASRKDIPKSFKVPRAATVTPVRPATPIDLHGDHPTTGLPTRADMLACLQTRLAHARRHSSRLALLCIDLDHFGAVCSIVGTPACDRVLQEVADRIARAVRAGDLIARVGSDEFVVVLEGLTRGADSATVAARMLEVIGERLEIAHRSLTLRASVGIALYPDDSASAESLLLQASVAMRRAKQRGRARLAFSLPM